MVRAVVAERGHGWHWKRLPHYIIIFIIIIIFVIITVIVIVQLIINADELFGSMKKTNTAGVSTSQARVAETAGAGPLHSPGVMAGLMLRDAPRWSDRACRPGTRSCRWAQGTPGCVTFIASGKL